MNREFHQLQKGDVFTFDISIRTRQNAVLNKELRQLIDAVQNHVPYLVVEATKGEELTLKRVYGGTYTLQPIRYVFQQLDANGQPVGNTPLFNAPTHNHEDSDYLPCTLIPPKPG